MSRPGFHRSSIDSHALNLRGHGSHESEELLDSCWQPRPWCCICRVGWFPAAPQFYQVFEPMKANSRSQCHVLRSAKALDKTDMQYHTSICKHHVLDFRHFLVMLLPEHKETTFAIERRDSTMRCEGFRQRRKVLLLLLDSSNIQITYIYYDSWLWGNQSSDSQAMQATKQFLR